MVSLYRQYPAIGQYLDQQTVAGLNQVAQLGASISNDVNSFKARMQGGGFGGHPQQQFHQPQPQPMGIQQNMANFAVQGVGQPNQGHSPTVGSVPSGSGSGMFLGVQEPVAKPTSAWGTHAQPTPPQQPQAPVQPAVEGTAPAHVSQIQLNPRAHIPQGHTIDPQRPYDDIRNPGGVIIKPAHLVKWKRTPGSDDPYPIVYNPQTHIRFLVKWIDGVVKELVVPFEPEMDYLKHEINETLRTKAMRPNGIVVPLPKYSDSASQAPTDVATAKELLSNELITPEHLAPVQLTDWITGSSDLENESVARQQVIELLGLDPEGPVPAHEYATVQMHEMDISAECYNALLKLSELSKISEVGEALKTLLQDGLLPLRYYNFIVKRLTNGVNDFLTDSLSMVGIRIDDFIEDAPGLGEYLRGKKGSDIEQVWLGNVQPIVARSIAMAEQTIQGEDTSVYGVIDEYINFQLDILSENLSNLNLSEEACVVSPKSHPMITTALRAMVERAKDSGLAKRVRMRLITADGFYYEVVVGKLVKSALLLKRV